MSDSMRNDLEGNLARMASAFHMLSDAIERASGQLEDEPTRIGWRYLRDQVRRAETYACDAQTSFVDYLSLLASTGVDIPAHMMILA